MKIFVTGARGIPGIPGGVEKHCEELYPRIAAKGHEIFLCTRSFYVSYGAGEWRGVKLVPCFAPHRKNLEAIMHTFFSLLKAYRCRPDIVHIHSIGPSLLTPFAKMLGYMVVVTNHGPDYDRRKWGRAARVMLRLGQKLGGIFADEVIAVSSVIAGIVEEKCGRKATVIHNGVSLPPPGLNGDYLDEIGVRRNRYILTVARFVPEKGLHDLIEAFSSLNTGVKLVVAGDADHETDYSRELRRMASVDRRIVMTGYITGGPLEQLYRHARLFVLPSHHEGLPIALLEAMSHGLSVLVSDIPANIEVGLPGARYFRRGDVKDLKEKMSLLLETEVSDLERRQLLKRMEENYGWDDIAARTIGVYRKVLREKNSGRCLHSGMAAEEGKDLRG